MITFDSMCNQLGLEPKAVREIIKGDYEIIITGNCGKFGNKEKCEAMEKFLKWYLKELSENNLPNGR